MTIRSFLFTALVPVSLLAAACGDDSGSTGTGGAGGGAGGEGGAGATTTSTTTSTTGSGGAGGAAPMDMSKIRVAHLSPDAPAVDVCLYPAGGTPTAPAVGTPEGLAYPNATGYLDVPSGTYDAAIVLAGADCSDPVAVIEGLPLAADKAYTAAAVGMLAAANGQKAFEVTLLEDNLGAPAAGKAHLRFIHASADAPNVDVGVLANGAVTDVWSDVAFPTAGAYTPVDAPFTADVGVTVAGDTGVVIGFTNIDIPEGAIVDVFAIGLLTPANPGQALGALACINGVGCVQLDETMN
jgi:hypothetical protein